MLRPKKIKSKELMIFCRQFSTLINAGVTVLTAVKILGEQHKGRLFSKILGGVMGNLENGQSLSGSFALEGRAFPRLFVSMIEAGESGGRLDEVLKRLADFYEKDHDLRERIKTALIYPALILGATCTAMVFIISRVLPAYANIFLYFGSELPILTRLLLQLGSGADRYWPLALTVFSLVILAVRQFIRSAPGKRSLDEFLVRVPVYGELYRKVVVARFARILGILLHSGVNLLSSLELAEYSVGNTLYARFIRETRGSIRRGRGLSEMTAGSRLFPKMAVEMMAIGEHTGTLEGMLHKIADFTEGEIKYAVDRLSGLIEPVLILILAIFVGVIALSVFLPMFDMFEMVR